MVFGLEICGLVGYWTWPRWSDSLIIGAVASVVACMGGNRTESSRRLDRDEAAGGTRAGGGIICSGGGGCFVLQ